MRVYGEIQRVDEEQRMVWGYASTEARASDGLVITREAMADALPSYLEFPAVREMHQPSAVGRTDEAFVDDTGLYVGIKVVDEAAWLKVTERVYRAFSIGAKITARDDTDKTIVRALEIREISLVDRPADPGAKFDVYRAEGVEQEHDDMVKRTKDAGGADTLSRTDEGGQETVGAAGGQDTLVRGDEGGDTLAGADTLAREGGEGGDSLAGAEAGDAEGGSDGGPDAGEGALDPVTAAVEAARAATAGAAAALEAVERAVEPVATGRPVPAFMVEDIQRGMYDVSRLGDVLGTLAYLIFSADEEATYEGDNSPVPAKLRESFRSLAAAYKAMSDEELAELVAGVDKGNRTARAAGLDAVTEIHISGPEGLDIDALRRTFSDVAGREIIVNRVDEEADLRRTVDSLTADRDTLLRTVTEQADQLRTVTEGLQALERRFTDEPLPGKTVGALVRAVGKGNDQNAGAEAPAEDAAATISPELFRAEFDKLPESERAMVLTRVALANPRVLSHRSGPTAR